MFVILKGNKYRSKITSFHNCSMTSQPPLHLDKMDHNSVMDLRDIINKALECAEYIDVPPEEDSKHYFTSLLWKMQDVFVKLYQNFKRYDRDLHEMSPAMRNALKKCLFDDILGCLGQVESDAASKKSLNGKAIGSDPEECIIIIQTMLNQEKEAMDAIKKKVAVLQNAKHVAQLMLENRGQQF